MKYIGYCANENCERKGQDVNFTIPYSKIEAFHNEPPTCPKCGDFLQGDVIDAE